MTRCWNVLVDLPPDFMIPELTLYLATIREHVGPNVEVSADHFPYHDVNSIIRLGRALEPMRLGWMEEVVPCQQPELLKSVAGAIETPIAAGENIYLKEYFAQLCDLHAIDVVHLDLATAGGMLETKKIGDYAESRGIGMAMHFAGTPVSFMANVHCAAATENHLALELHDEDNAEWSSMFTPVGHQPLITGGFANVPLSAPGLGIELNEAEIMRRAHPENRTYFGPSEN